MDRGAEALPLTAQHGACGVTLMPRNEVIVTAAGRFLILDERESRDLQAALIELHAKLDLQRRATS
jgi:hypothetical protein